MSLSAKASLVLLLGGSAATLARAQAGYSPLPYPFQTPYNHSCALDAPQLSCPSQDPQQLDSCCTETYGGLVLSTQFWDTYTGLESQGQVLPANSWTLHGLWPDFCNGSYTGYCDISRQYDPAPSPNVSSNGTTLSAGNETVIQDALQRFGRLDLLAYMTKYWVNQGASSLSFWAHEFSKHATCYSTFQTACYGPAYVAGQEIVEFVDTAVTAYGRYPTYAWLANASIVPSNSTNYTLADIQNALTSASGAIPYLGCTGARYNTTAAGQGSTDSGRTVLDEVWYYNYARGRVANLELTPINSTSPSGCATSPGAIMYPVRSNGSEVTY